MCNANVAKAFDPVMGTVQLADKTKDLLTPKLPDIPAVPAPPMMQDEKAPDAARLRQRRAAAASTLLTGPAGVTASALNTGAPTLLGG